MGSVARIALVSSSLLVAAYAPSAGAAASLDAGARACIATVVNCSVVGPGEGGAGGVFTGATGVGAQTSASVDSESQIDVAMGATQDYGLFRGRGSVVVDVPSSTNGTFYGGSASGSARDTWTITSPGRSGAGSFRAYFTVLGSVAATPAPGGGLEADLRIALTAGNPPYAAGATGPIAAPGVYGFQSGASVPFTFGAPFPTEMVSSLSASVSSPANGAGYFATVLVDFSGGAYLSAIEVFDDQGQPVGDFAITTESGVAVPVPEPAAVASATAAGLALAGLARRPERQRSRRTRRDRR